MTVLLRKQAASVDVVYGLSPAWYANAVDTIHTYEDSTWNEDEKGSIFVQSPFDFGSITGGGAVVSRGRSVFFPPFRLDFASERLWRLAQPIPLRPKTFAVLRCLVEHPGQLCTKEVLFDAIWPETAVTDVVLKVCIRELRHALGDNARHPQFIETVHGRGYRFIGSVTEAPQPEAQQDTSRWTAELQHPGVASVRMGTAHGPMVGREAEIAFLHQCLDQVWGGARQIVWVAGEAGMGKTTVAAAFVTEARQRGDLWIGHGQCIEHYGAGEPYMPVLQALEQLCHIAGGQELIAFLAQQAPTWLLQMPWLLSEADLDRLQRATLGVTRERMLREMAQALDVLTAERPLLLVLEDLHWSDYATLDLLSVLARRQESARLLVLGTYRPEEVLGKEHPLATLTQELQIHGHSQELPLRLLTEAAVRAYLMVCVPQTSILDELAQCIHQRTEGNPLFMVNMVDYVVAQDVPGVLAGSRNPQAQLAEAAQGMPESLRQMLERRFDRLRSEEQGVLEVGSVAGNEFAAAVVAVGLGADVEQIEAWCEGLARRGQWLRSCGSSVWPDGTVSARYGFIHALYQQVVYNRVPAARRLRLHRRIGKQLEAGYGEQARGLAAELVVHFEQGREYHRAVHYCQQAAENALRRYAYREAITHLSKGLTLLPRLPDTPERLQQELAVQTTLGPALIATKGMAAPEVEQTYARARELCQQAGEAPQLLQVLFGSWQFYLVRGELHIARELGEQYLSLAQRQHDPASLLVAHWALGVTLFYLGEFARSRVHAERGTALYNTQQHGIHAFLYEYGQDPGIGCLGHTAQALWMLGYPDQAQQRSDAALALSRKLSHPYDVVFALNQAVVLHQLRREGRAAFERAEEVMAFCMEQGFTQQLAMGTILRGWGLATQGQADKGIAQMYQGLAASQAAGIELGRAPVLAQLAEVYRHIGQTEAGLRLLGEALAVMDRTGERWWEAEVHRLQGEILLKQIVADEHLAETCFRHALDVARGQEAKSLELRVTTSLSRLWQQQGKREAAHNLLAPIYGWFTEGFDTVDLKEAKTLLEELVALTPCSTPECGGGSYPLRRCGPGHQS